MAANKRGKSAPKGGTARKGTKKNGQEERQSISREVIAFSLLLLAVFTLLGFFQADAFLIGWLISFQRGLVGAGVYILPVLYSVAAVLLLRSHGKPMLARTLLTMALALLLGALVQVFADPVSWNASLVKQLYLTGVSGPAGGVFSGLLGAGLSTALSKFGAAILLLLLFAVCLLAPLNMTPRSVILAIRNRPRAEMEPEEQRDMAERIVNRIAGNKIARSEERKKAREEFNVDLPVDEPPLPEQKTARLRKAEAVSPDQFILERRKEAAAQQMTMDELPKQREDAMPLPLITDLIEQKKKVARLNQKGAPEPVSVEGPVDVVELGAHREEPTADMPVFHPEEFAEKAEEDAPWDDEEIPEDLPDGALLDDEDDEPEEPASPAVKDAAPYVYPPMELLNPSTGGTVDATEEMRVNAERLSDSLRSFGIQPNIVNVTRGPTVTRYELQLNRGVKLSKITSLSEDIALSLGATGVRISAIPEKLSVVGIEVPNRQVSTVFAREVIDSKEFAASKSRISFAVGKDIGGNRIIGNIAKLPHLLIAGTTGSGKSVCMNSLIISLLYKSTPDEVRMIMIDPKMVELGVYNGIPHLLIPVVTDPKKASGSLQWAVTEMMRRYSIMAESGTRDIASYNKIIEGNPERKKLPQIVLVIDELADLMLVAAKEVEESICRVAQMGRASGVHLVIATQRPSANVITGLMKANIPSRIAFAVASAMESRIILDTSGAEKLVGRGDMLYAPLGEGKAKRIQGCFITDEEVQRVAEFVKQGGRTDYSKEIMDHIDRKASETGKSGGNLVFLESEPDDDRDELLFDAVDTVLEMGQASVSVLQRKLKLGYSRASRIVDQMEEMGVVGPHKGSKPRDILVTKEKWELIKRGEAPLHEPVPDELD
ncbi:MAG: DNA translocase FtsK [Oscillospiraceae bacterium]|nr:DNA translocase FtsK [Oscillospiraceae bacterium]